MGLPSLSRERRKECNIFLGHTGEATSLKLYVLPLKSLFLLCFPRMVFTRVGRDSKTVSTSKDQNPQLWKTGLGLWFPNSLYLLWCVLDAYSANSTKQCWEEEFWRPSHIPSITISKGQSQFVFPFNLAREERQLAPSNTSQKAIWLRMPGTVLFPTAEWDFTRYMTQSLPTILLPNKNTF